MKINLKLIGLIVGLMFALSQAAFGQAQTGTVEGTVTDPTGKVVAGATVTLTDKKTGNAQTATTTDAGLFRFGSLVPGDYSLTIEGAGFSKANVERLAVQVGTVARADVQMKVGGANETVNVDIGDTEVQVDTTRQTVDGVITGRQITSLPLNDRNFLDLAALQPSVTVVDGGVIDPTKVNTFRAVRVNGGSGTGTRVQIEGIDVTDETVGTTVANFSTDAVQEFNLSRSSFDLSTSLTTSGAVSIASRTGSNQFSGSVFYFKQDDKFDARPGFEAEKPEFNRDQEGYRFGGPLFKDKLFFFSNAERLNQQDFTSFTSSNFSAFNEAATLPVKTFNTLQRADYHITDKVRFFYLFNHSDDVSTGGTLWSPFQNIDWTNTHVVGLNVSGAKLTHAIRFGYVNFNNQISSAQLSGFDFFRAPGGTAIQVNVGDLSWGPNDLSPQQTYQDNLELKYDGSAVMSSHIIRWGVDRNRIDLGGFANFTGPLALSGVLGPADPTASVLSAIRIGPDAGFFTARPGHNLPYGDKKDTRWSWYVGDTWKVTKNFTLNFGVRHNYDTAFFTGPGVRELTGLSRYATGLGLPAKYPKTAFSPQIGFAWDVFGDGKTSVRGGLYRTYEMNIFNNAIFDENARNAPGIGPLGLDITAITGPTGTPIVVAGSGCPSAQVNVGNYSCLLDGTRTIAGTAGFIESLYQAVQTAYLSGSSYNPNANPSNFDLAPNSGLNAAFPGDYKLPYSIQFNIGFQRELTKNHVLSVDYVRHRGIGLPLQTINIENNLDSRFFNKTAAQTAINNFLTNSCQGRTISQAISQGCQNSSGATFFPTISNFGLASTTIWPGATERPSTVVIAGGYSLYRAIQVSLIGRFGDSFFDSFALAGQKLFRGMSYTVGYALGRNESTSGGSRPEFRAGVLCNRDYNRCFGPNGLDRTHNLTVSASLDLIGGFRLDQIYRLSTAPPLSITVPNSSALSPGVTGANGIFTVDFNGDGGTSTTPRADLLPGTNVGDFGRRINNLAALNQYIIRYNNDVAGHVTPHGQVLIDQGLFTLDQLVALKAVSPVLPTIPLGNPDPFETRFNADYRLSRPIKIVSERFVLEPSFSVFNVFNNNAHATYNGLTPGSFGTLVFNYNTPGNVARLEESRGLIFRRRQLQFGIRFSF